MLAHFDYNLAAGQLERIKDEKKKLIFVDLECHRVLPSIHHTDWARLVLAIPYKNKW